VFERKGVGGGGGGGGGDRGRGGGGGGGGVLLRNAKENRCIMPKQIRSEKSFSSAGSLLSAALLERWPQVCRVNFKFRGLPTNRFVSTTQKSMISW